MEVSAPQTNLNPRLSERPRSSEQPGASVAAGDSVVATRADVQNLAAEVERLRAAVAGLKVAQPRPDGTQPTLEQGTATLREGEAKIAEPATPTKLADVKGFSPFCPAFTLPVTAMTVVANGLALTSTMGSGSLMAQAGPNASALFSDPGQATLVRGISAVGNDTTLRSMMPLLGGMAAGMLLLKGIHGMQISMDQHNKVGIARSALDIATGFATGLATVPGYQVVGSMSAFALMTVNMGLGLAQD